MKHFFFSLALLFAIASLTVGAALAQPGSGGPGPGPGPGAPTEIPLDGGASLLLAGGVAYGLRRLRACRRARIS